MLGQSSVEPGECLWRSFLRLSKSVVRIPLRLDLLAQCCFRCIEFARRKSVKSAHLKRGHKSRLAVKQCIMHMWRYADRSVFHMLQPVRRLMDKGGKIIERCHAGKCNLPAYAGVTDD